MPSYPYALTITNASFSSGATGWTTLVGGGLGTYGSGGNDGGAYVRAGSSALNQSGQIIDLPSDVLADVDAGLLSLLISCWQSGFSGDSDSGSASVEFYDAEAGGGNLVGMIATGFYHGPSGSWAERTANMWVPPGARSLRLCLRGRRSGGNDNDAYFDSFSLTLSRRARPHKQLVYLSGHEVDTFTATLGSSGSFSGAGYGGSWHRGPSGGIGYPTREYGGASWRGYKDYAVPVGAYTDVNAGNGTMEITFNTGSYDNKDPTQVYVEALDGSNASLGTIYDSGLAIGSVGQDTPFRGTAAVPANTRKLRLWNYKLRNTGAYADGGFNRLSLQLEADGVLTPDVTRRRHAAMMIG